MIKQLGFKSAYLLGAVNPRTGEHIGLVFENLDTEVMNVHLELISNSLPEDVHVLLVWDQAGFHKSKELKVPSNITLCRLEPYSPELNPVEKLWEWIKGNFLGNSIFKNIKDIFQAGVSSWRNLTDALVKSICRVKWLPRTV